jgi:hypothetical protein
MWLSGLGKVRLAQDLRARLVLQPFEVQMSLANTQLCLRVQVNDWNSCIAAPTAHFLSAAQFDLLLGFTANPQGYIP